MLLDIIHVQWYVNGIFKGLTGFIYLHAQNFCKPFSFHSGEYAINGKLYAAFTEGQDDVYSSFLHLLYYVTWHFSWLLSLHLHLILIYAHRLNISGHNEDISR